MEEASQATLKIGEASPWHRGDIDLQCLGQQQDLHASMKTMPCLCTHAQLSARTASRSATHCLFALLRKSAAECTTEAPSSTHQGRGAGPAPHCISILLQWLVCY
eukprot:1158409-Pelagomonas_calceolata.AAC.6